MGVTLTRIGCLEVEEFSVKLLSLLSIIAKKWIILHWSASSDRHSKDSDKQERRKMHLELIQRRECREEAAIDENELLEVVQDTGKRALALRKGKKEMRSDVSWTW